MSIAPTEHFWPSTQDVDVLSGDLLMALYSDDKIDNGALDRYGQLCHSFLINNTKYTIPRILTSRSAIYHLGFNPKTVEEIWKYVTSRMSATPTPATEFWKLLRTWLNDRIHDIIEEYPFPNATSRELLDRLGLQEAAQIQNYKLKPPSGVIRLADQPESNVLDWAKRAITRKWTAIATLEFVLLRGEKNIQIVGLNDVLKEFKLRPIDSEMAYDFDPTFLQKYQAFNCYDFDLEIFSWKIGSYYIDG